MIKLSRLIIIVVALCVTAAFANYDPPSIELLSDFENVVIQFKVEEYDLSFFLYRLEGELWKVNSLNPIEKTSATFNESNWEEYTKHEYATFNKFHTWVEYINRLITVLSGFIFLFLLAGSLKFRKENKWIPILSFIAFFFMLVEAFLGKMVVDSNLKPTMITIHMVIGLLIIGLILGILFIIRRNKTLFKYHSLFNRLLIVSIIFSLIQIAMGTQVRQFIDEQVKLFGFENKEYSLMNPSFKFYFHRSFTIAIILVNFGLFYLNQLHGLGYKLVKWILVLLFLETITGILMYYAEFPLGTQAIHLLSGALLFGVQFYLWLQSRKTQ